MFYKNINKKSLNCLIQNENISIGVWQITKPQTTNHKPQNTKQTIKYETKTMK